MKIYTKRGDKGETGLYGDQRVSKDHPRVRVYGDFDELNATLGVVLATLDQDESSKWLKGPFYERLRRIQGELLQLGAELATPAGRKVPSPLIQEAHVTALENEIDEMEAVLPKQTHFLLPGGSVISATLHLARTVTRRAERELVAFHHNDAVRGEVLEYVNRLADYLFVCARYANHEAGAREIFWTPGV